MESSCPRCHVEQDATDPCLEQMGVCRSCWLKEEQEDAAEFYELSQLLKE